MVYGCGVFIGQFLSQVALSWEVLLGAGFFTLPMGLIVYGLNDIADRESDAMNPRKGGAEGAILQPLETKRLLVIILVAAALCTSVFCLTKQYGLLIATLVIYLFAYLYSLKPIRLKARPGLDSLSNGILVGSIFMAGCWAKVRGTHLPAPPVLLLAATIVCTAGYHALTTVMDYATDKASGDRTIGVAFGKTTTPLLSAMAFLVSALLLARQSPWVSLDLVLCAGLICLGCRYNSPRAIWKICLGIFLLLLLGILPIIV